jgi:hypothetical protein
MPRPHEIFTSSDAMEQIIDWWGAMKLGGECS